MNTTYLKPLQLGALNLPTNIIQGPLAGYSCAAMRTLTWQYSNPAYCATEMVSAGNLVCAPNQPKRFLWREENEKILCYQLAGKNPEILAQATRMVNNLGVEIIELNCGCPVNKIRRNGAGSKLLSSPDILANLIKILRDNTDAVISIKIRVAGDHSDQDDIAIAKTAEQAGADFIVVHGRHWTERYGIPCRYEQIKNVVGAVNIPVIGNGDVNDTLSFKKMIDETGCAGVMVARASVGQPWLFSQIETELAGESYEVPSTKEIGEIFIDHIERLAALDDEHRAVLQSRSLAKYYARDKITHRSDFLEKLMLINDFPHFQQLVKTYFK